MIDKLILNADTIVEIGANVGVYTTFFALSPGSEKRRLFAFEPSRRAFKRLLENLEANKVLHRVNAFCCAVGQQTGIAPFFEPEGHLTNGSLRPEFAQLFADSVARHDIVVVGPDLICELVRQPGRLLLKIDAEGFEAQILLGLEQLIRSARPVIILEVLHLYCDELNALDFLWQCGYLLLEIRPEGLVRRERFVGGEYRDYLLTVEGSPIVAGLIEVS